MQAYGNPLTAGKRLQKVNGYGLDLIQMVNVRPAVEGAPLRIEHSRLFPALTKVERGMKMRMDRPASAGNEHDQGSKDAPPDQGLRKAACEFKRVHKASASS
jgi:hypothetical protein